MTNDKFKEAIETYGPEIVAEVMNLVQMSDPDGCYTTFEDMGMFEHSECVEFLYFKN